MAPSTDTTATDQLVAFLRGEKVIAVCGRADDAQAWMDALGRDQCIAVGLDKAAMAVSPQGVHPTESSRVSSHNETIAGLDGCSWLGDLARSFDPGRQATVLVPDPLDPPSSGTRRRLGRRPTSWQMFEDKTVTDVLWDRLGVQRPRSIVTDRAADPSALGRLVDAGNGVVCALQPTGSAPTGAGEGIWWWREGVAPEFSFDSRRRLKLMPLLPGVPVRLHGMAFAEGVSAFPPMEIIALPRLDRSTFLCCGVVPFLAGAGELEELTHSIGVGLRKLLDYRGAYAVDGIMTEEGFLPTDLNTRLTSALEAAPSAIRVQIQAANVLAREGEKVDADWLCELARRACRRDTLTIYGAAGSIAKDVQRNLAVRWNAGELIATDDGESDGHLHIAPSLRGWTLTAELWASRLPSQGYLNAFAPAVFRLSDGTLGTDFGHLRTPFGVGHPGMPNPRQEVRSKAVGRGA